MRQQLIKLQKENARLEMRVKNLEVQNAHQDNLIGILTKRVDIASDRIANIVKYSTS